MDNKKQLPPYFYVLLICVLIGGFGGVVIAQQWFPSQPGQGWNPMQTLCAGVGGGLGGAIGSVIVRLITGQHPKWK